MGKTTKTIIILAIMSIFSIYSVIAGEYSSDSNTVGLWLFNEGTGTTTLNHKTGVSNAVSSPEWASGLVGGNALRFSGGVPSGYYSYVNAEVMNVKSSMTLEATIKPEQVSGIHSIMDNLYNLAFWIDRGKLKFGVFDQVSGLKTVTSATSLSANTLYTVGATYNHTVGKLCVYINGVQDACASGKVKYWVNNNNNLLIGQGHRIGSFTSQFVGMVDNVRLSNVVRDMTLGPAYELISEGPTVQVEAGSTAVPFLTEARVLRTNTDASILLFGGGASGVTVTGVSGNATQDLAGQFTVFTDSATGKTAVMVNTGNFESIRINYNMPGPTKSEGINFVVDEKNVVVSSDLAYTNVLARTTLYNPLPAGLIELFKVNSDGTREPVTVQNYIDNDGDGYVEEIEWIVPHLSTEDFVTNLMSNFNVPRINNPDLPNGWYAQADGFSNADDSCSLETSWRLTSVAQTFSGLRGVLFDPQMDTSNHGCGIKLPRFSSRLGTINLSFNLQSNFTNPNSALEFINIGDISNMCDVKFNSDAILEQSGCTATLTDLGTGWKSLSLVWEITSSEQLSIYVAPPFLLQETGETGTMIVDNVRITLP